MRPSPCPSASPKDCLRCRQSQCLEDFFETDTRPVSVKAVPAVKPPVWTPAQNRAMVAQGLNSEAYLQTSYSADPLPVLHPAGWRVSTYSEGQGD